MKRVAVALGVGVVAAVVAWGRLPEPAPEPGSVVPRKLEMRMVDDGLPAMEALAKEADEDPRARDLGIKAEPDSWISEQSDATHFDYYLTATDRIVDGRRVDGRAVLEKYLAGAALPGGRTFGYERVVPRSMATQRRREASWRTYALAPEVIASSAHLAAADVVWDPTTNRPEVIVTFNDEGRRRFGDATGANVGQKIAIILDDTVMSAPVIQAAITGGKTNITMGGGEPRQIQRAAEDLVNALRAGMPKLPTPVPTPLRDRRGLTPMIAALAALLAWLALRFVPFARPIRTTPPAGPLAWRQLGVTVLALGLLALRGFVRIPFLNHALLRDIGVSAHDDKVSVFALGISPVLSAYVLIELVALLIPGWRRRRHAGAAARVPLARAAGVLSLVLALVQGFFVAAWMTSVGAGPGSLGGDPLLAPGLGPELLVAATLAAGVACHAFLAALIGRFGLGNGWALIAFFDCVRNIPNLPNTLSGVAGLVAMAVVTGWLLRRRLALPDGQTMRLPAAGLSASNAGPVWTFVAAPIIALAAQLPFARNLPPAWMATLRHATEGAGAFVLIAMLTGLFSWLFARRRAAVVQRRLLPYGIIVSFAYLALVDLLLAGSVALMTAIALDLWAELRHLGHGKVVVESLQDPHEVDAAAARHPGAHFRGEHLRTLLYFFGPWIPIEAISSTGERSTS